MKIGPARKKMILQSIIIGSFAVAMTAFSKIDRSPASACEMGEELRISKECKQTEEKEKNETYHFQIALGQPCTFGFIANGYKKVSREYTSGSNCENARRRTRKSLAISNTF